MAQVTIEQALRIAIELHQAGRLADAEAIYRQVLAAVPDHADALNLLGMLAGQSGQAFLAIELIARAIAISPGTAEYHGNLGESYLRAGRWEEAIASTRQAIALKPGLAVAHVNLGAALHKVGHTLEAIAAYERALALQGEDAELLSNLGVALHEAGRIDEAIAAFDRALACNPAPAAIHTNLGNALRDKRQPEQAVAAYRRAIEREPGDVLAWSNLGACLQEIGESEEAIAALRRAIEIGPDNAEAHLNLGAALHAAERLDDAIDSYRRALELKPGLAEAQANLGNVLKDQGRLDEAIAAFDAAIALKPGFALAESNRLLTLHYHPDLDAQALLAAHRDWARRVAAPLAAGIGPHPHDRTPHRRLRIGFVSPDFRAHPVGQSLLPWLLHRDRRGFEFVCYSDVRVPDPLTRQFQDLADEWHDLRDQGDPRAADQIREDRIDILVDLALHTANNRMGVFARKPAPVQVTMLGLPSTTGLTTVDYRLTDPYLDPPGVTDADYAERSLRLPRSFWVYWPLEESAPALEPPVVRNGFITFGCLNQFAKVSRPAQELWVRILQAVPGAHLVIQAPPGSHRDGFRNRFAQAGIAPERLEFLGKTLRRSYLDRFSALDLCLDPFPYNGHTSTLDALWMGVPVVTLAGKTCVARGGVSLLTNVGLPELIARSPREYVDIAVSVAVDRAFLARLRQGLRARMEATGLLDGARFARDLETAFRAIWTDWCRR